MTSTARKRIAIVAGLCSLLGAWAGLVGSAAAAEMFALVVGVNDCPHFRRADGQKARALRGAQSDAAAMAELLQSQFGAPADNMRLLVGHGASRVVLERAWNELADKLTRDDHFVFYFAGHGTQCSDTRPFDEDDRLDEALCPADVTASGENLLLDDELALWLDRLAARYVTVILDCCHAGTGIKSADTDIAVRALPLEGVSRTKEAAAPWRELAGTSKRLDRRYSALYACQPFQQAYERRFPGQKAGQRSGQLTHYLLETLRGRPQPLAARQVAEAIAARLDASFNATRSELGEKQQPVLDAARPDAPLLWKLSD